MTREQTRRDVLRTGAAAGSLAVIGSLAGCSSLLGSGGAAYADWLYAPGTRSDGGNNTTSDDNHYGFIYSDASAVRANEDNLGEFNESAQVSSYPYDQMGVDYGEIDEQTILGFRTYVVEGSFNEGDVTGALEGNGFSQEDSYSGYTLLSREQTGGFGGSTQVVGVSGSTAVAGSGSGGSGPAPRALVETTIDASEGAVERYGEANEDMSTLVGELGSAASVRGATREPPSETVISEGQFQGEVASGAATSINGSTSEQTRVRVFETSSDANTGDIDDWIDTEPFTQNLTNVSTSANGRVVTVTGELPTEELFNTTTSSS